LKKAVILLSGGIDSATTAAIAMSNGFIFDALTFSYGQKHSIEIDCARSLASFFRIERHAVIDIPTGIFRSALTEKGEAVPKNRVEHDKEIPSTYVPARNILFLSYALAYAESWGIGHIFMGATAVDYSGYPDCRPEFFASFSEIARIGTKTGIEGHSISIETPLINMAKSDIIKKGISLGVDFYLTHSCYDPDEDGACGQCDSCIIRARGFKDAGIEDQTRYSKMRS
jgi:7-cyano-7-deazaguanine synthase